MAETKHQHHRELVRNFILENPNASKNEVVKHFTKQKMNQRTVYNYYKRIKEGWDLKKSHGGGKPKAVLTTKMRNQLIKFFDGKTGVSVNRASRKFKRHPVIIKRWMEECGIERRVRKKIPYSDEKQTKKQRRILNKISRDEFLARNDSIDVIMDDETYIDLNGWDFGGNKFYFDRGTNPIPDEVKFRAKKKFPEKLLVWVAISRKGHSQFYFRSQKEGAVNAQVYKNECITKRLIPFINKHYPDKKYIFWPDLASAHYAGSVTQVLREQNVNFLAKDRNPPNCPQLRAIENFWAIFKSKIFQDGFTPKSISDLQKRAKKVVRTFQESLFERLMKDVGQKIRAAATRGSLNVQN